MHTDLAYPMLKRLDQARKKKKKEKQRPSIKHGFRSQAQTPNQTSFKNTPLTLMNHTTP